MNTSICLVKQSTSGNTGGSAGGHFHASRGQPAIRLVGQCEAFLRPLASLAASRFPSGRRALSQSAATPPLPHLPIHVHDDGPGPRGDCGPGSPSRGQCIITGVSPGATRPCTHCLRVLPRTADFYAHDKRSSDGYHSWCRDCQREKALAWQQDNREWAKASSRAHHKKNRDRNLASFRSWAAAHPLAASARNAVQQALRCGRLLMPDTCDACEKHRRVQFHHEDYARPLWGTSLCRGCHKRLHLEVRSGRARLGAARQGGARSGSAGLGWAGLGQARQGKVW